MKKTGRNSDFLPSKMKFWDNFHVKSTTIKINTKLGAKSEGEESSGSY
jgi:hypothetical protein